MPELFMKYVHAVDGTPFALTLALATPLGWPVLLFGTIAVVLLAKRLVRSK